MALKADEYLKKTYANVSRMRNCDVILKLAAGVDKARLDAAFSTQFEDRFGVPAERKFFLEKDVGSRLSEPVRHGDGVLIRLSYQYIGGLSSFRGIMVFADIS